jgi:hypothetical protein
VILFLLFTNDVTICMELDPGIHIGSTWFVLETGCDTNLLYNQERFVQGLACLLNIHPSLKISP